MKLLKKLKVPVQCFSKFRHSQKFSDLVRSQIVETLKRKTFLFDLLDNVKRNFLKLSQRTHRLPHPAITHLGQGEGFVGQLSPTIEKDNLENSSEKKDYNALKKIKILKSSIHSSF
jgi:hypothetical protein